MKTSDFDYDLPEERIASTPPLLRGESRLLVLDTVDGSIEDRHYGDSIDYLSQGDVLILNDTKVIPARLMTHKRSNDAPREIIILEQHGKTDDWFEHRVLYRKSIRAGDQLVCSNETILEVAEIIGDGIALVRSPLDLRQLADQLGSVPLPPYLHRPATEDDKERYQTVWAREAGSVAAPTASLNMTEPMIDRAKAKGVVVAYATLHVGLGTFLPIRSEELDQHTMHKEYFEIPAASVAAIQTARQNKKRVVAVGTTITRTLEYAHEAIVSEPARDLSGEADIFIYPGYSFQVVDCLLTNFHAPKSTVLMLVAAFAGPESIRIAYQHAINKKYAFLSYGDSMFIQSRHSEANNLRVEAMV